MNLKYPKFTLYLFVLAFTILEGCSSDNKNKSVEKITSNNTKPASTKSSSALKEIDFLKANETHLKYQEYLAPYKFEDFPATDKYNDTPAELDVTSHIEAALYRKTFTKALHAGSNFAGHFTLVSINCSTHCQDNYIIDTRTGKVCDKVRSIWGASYRKNSKLLIVNAPDSMNIEIYQKLPRAQPEVYIIQNNLLYKAKLVKK